MKKAREHSQETRLVQLGVGFDEQTGAISIPIHPSATYRHPGVGESTGYDYTRSGNPTRQVLEEGLADLEGGCRALAFSSGMAALTTFFLHFSQGDHLVVSEDLYGGTYRVLDHIFSGFGLSVTYADTTDTVAVSKVIKSNTKAILIETPGNPLLGISDLEALGKLCREKGLIYAVDNTFLSPVLQKPFEFGADVVIYSATKYLGGHNDLCAGILIAREEELGERLYFLQNTTGAVLPPFDCWLLVRSLKTLSLRVERQCANAQIIAQWLQEHSKVRDIYYPGLKQHPGYELSKKQAKGFGAMLSFRVDTENTARTVLKRLQLISFAESLGGVESLMTLPSVQTHADIPEEERQRLGICDRLLRLSVGTESAEDIILDLKQALA